MVRVTPICKPYSSAIWKGGPTTLPSLAFIQAQVKATVDATSKDLGLNSDKVSFGEKVWWKRLTLYFFTTPPRYLNENRKKGPQKSWWLSKKDYAHVFFLNWFLFFRMRNSEFRGAGLYVFLFKDPLFEQNFNLKHPPSSKRGAWCCSNLDFFGCFIWVGVLT